MTSADQRSQKILMIALDAAEPQVIEDWTDDGTLPNLQSLRERGAYGRLGSTADWLSGSPWPSFYTGTSPSEHGLYHCLQWRAEEMRMARPSSDWLTVRPFWRDLAAEDRRVIAVDLPMTYAPEPFAGVEVAGYASHDQLAPPASYPTDVMRWINREIGPRPMGAEVYGPQSAVSLLAVRDELIEATRSGAKAAEALMKRDNWSLCMVGFGATHRGGHKLWDDTGVDGQVSPENQEEFRDALKKVYVTCDEAVGRLIRLAGEGVTVIVFSLHGMGPNTSRVEMLNAMLSRILSPETAQSDTPDQPAGERGPKDRGASRGFLSRLRAVVPIEWRNFVKSRLPLARKDRLTAFWRLRSIDWSPQRPSA